MGQNQDGSQDELLSQVVRMFVEATPPVDAPIADWRAGFEAMAAQFEVPGDGVYESVTANGVPGLLVTAPKASSERLVIHFHSGGYVQGSAQAYRNFAYRLSQVSGAGVFVPDYRLAPEHLYPAAVEDASEVYDWALRKWAPGSIAISGDSAGGGLAMATLLKIRDEGKPQPAAGVGISPLLDLAGEGGSALSNQASDPLIDQNMIVSMGKVYIGDIDPHEHPYCSPVWGTKEGLPPLLLTASTTETLRDDAVRFAEGVGAVGGEARLSLVPGMIHIWTLFPFLEQAAASMAEIGAFLDERFRA
ncbi:alpha/beta hydrolase [Leucobacter weissii]|uniref:Alpha/beta hydrolase n=1 Tax=Leucobacter weissii TaxID=1983706 RepID=A0A939MMN8_9MICO|nr:alpha/beta hydrolase [Leucobacter weissii]MBO1901417.1 alpha/beta hydrolase [Leucobacter weissii]